MWSQEFPKCPRNRQDKPNKDVVVKKVTIEKV